MGAKLPSLRDLMGDDAPAPADAGPQSPEQMWAIAQAWNAAANGKVERIADG